MIVVQLDSFTALFAQLKQFKTKIRKILLESESVSLKVSVQEGGGDITWSSLRLFCTVVITETDIIVVFIFIFIFITVPTPAGL